MKKKNGTIPRVPKKNSLPIVSSYNDPCNPRIRMKRKKKKENSMRNDKKKTNNAFVSRHFSSNAQITITFSKFVPTFLFFVFSFGFSCLISIILVVSTERLKSIT